MVVDPVVTPVTTPPETVAVPGLALDQLPPGARSVSVFTKPTHTVFVPVIVPETGNGFTDTGIDAYAVPQLLVIAYETKAVPAETPVTTPKVFTVSINGLELVQVPSETVSVIELAAPTHIVVVPLSMPAFGLGFIVTG